MYMYIPPPSKHTCAYIHIHLSGSPGGLTQLLLLLSLYVCKYYVSFYEAMTPRVNPHHDDDADAYIYA